MLGTTLLLAATVALVAFLAIAMRPEAAPGDVPELALDARAEPGTGRIHLVHNGGDAFDAGSLAYVATVNGSAPVRGTLGSAGTSFAAGDGLLLALPGAGAGSRVHVDVLSPDGRRVVSAVSITVPAPPSPPVAPAGFSISVASTPSSVAPPAVLRVEAAIAHPEGRKAVAGVLLNASSVQGTGAQALADDGLGADRTAGDGVWSGHALALPGGGYGPRTLTVDATDIHGATATRSFTILTQEMTIGFNATIFSHVGVWIHKFQGGNPGDSATTHLKLRLPTAPLALYGATYQVSGASMWYLNYRPNQPTLEAKLAQSCSAPFPDAAQGSATVRVFSTENATLGGWLKDRDTLRFFYTVKFDRVSGPASAPSSFEEIISPSRTELYFLLRREETMTEVKDSEGWSVAYRDCSVDA